MGKIILPEFQKSSFNCPICGVFSVQYWRQLTEYLEFQSGEKSVTQMPIWSSHCSHCNQRSFWEEEGKIIIFPFVKKQQINPDLNEKIKDTLKQAILILEDSPPAAAAMLRLSLEMICDELNAEGGNLFEKICSIYEKEHIKVSTRAMHLVRIIVGNSIHFPPKIDLGDSEEIAKTLLGLIDIIAERVLTEPKKINDLWAKIPESKRLEIEKNEPHSEPKGEN